MTGAVSLRDAAEEDLALFFEHQRDPAARWMAAFTSRDPADRAAFMATWQRLLSSPTIRIQAILLDDVVAGCFMGYEEQPGMPEVSYWLGREHWGLGVATQALKIYLTQENRARPIFARASKDNVASLRVLAKCGFSVLSEGRGYAHARGEEIEEYLLQLSAAASPTDDLP